MAVKFRRQALSRLGDGDQLDIPVRLTRPHTWVAVVATIALVASGVAFLVVGSLPRNIQMVGVLAAARGNFAVQTLEQGQVTAVHVEPGTTFAAREPIVRLQVGERAVDVVAAEAGRVLSLSATVGQVVPAGAPIVLAARAGQPGDHQVAILFAPVSEAFRVAVGSRVEIAVDSAPADAFGVLTGRVVSVARASDDPAELSRFLGTDEVSSGADGPRINRVTVELERGDTTSGYRWSTTTGPPAAIESGTSIVGTVHEAPVRPISWLLP